MIIYIEHIPSGKHWTVSEKNAEEFDVVLEDWWKKGCAVSLNFVDEFNKVIILTGNITKDCVIEQMD